METRVSLKYFVNDCRLILCLLTVQTKWNWIYQLIRNELKVISSYKIKVPSVWHVHVCTFRETQIENTFFFSVWVFFRNHSRITGLEGKGEDISLTPHCHFDLLHRHLDIRRVITAGSSPLHIGRSRTRTGNLWFPSEIRQPLSYAPFNTGDSLYRVYPKQWNLDLVYLQDHNLEYVCVLFEKFTCTSVLFGRTLVVAYAIKPQYLLIKPLFRYISMFYKSSTD